MDILNDEQNVGVVPEAAVENFGNERNYPGFSGCICKFLNTESSIPRKKIIFMFAYLLLTRNILQ